MPGKIAFIQTGGTIDKDYPRKTKGYAFEIATPAFDRVLNKLKPNFQYDTYELMKKDSLEITDDDRLTLLDFVASLAHDLIIITHGTDTLIETASALNSIKNKVIVVTGAKLPERFTNSDAPINIGVAIGAVTSLKHGVYICMQGLVIPEEKAAHDKEEGTFYRIDQ